MTVQANSEQWADFDRDRPRLVPPAVPPSISQVVFRPMPGCTIDAAGAKPQRRMWVRVMMRL